MYCDHSWGLDARAECCGCKILEEECQCGMDEYGDGVCDEGRCEQCEFFWKDGVFNDGGDSLLLGRIHVGVTLGVKTTTVQLILTEITAIFMWCIRNIVERVIFQECLVQRNNVVHANMMVVVFIDK